jgi:methionyl-tRNA formyltransferase
MLPKYRGPAPIQWAILNGDKETGVSIMYLNEKMDAGDIIKQQVVTIGEDETTGELWNRLSRIGAELLLETVKNIDSGIIIREKQPEEYTLAPMLNKEMSKIDWNVKKAADIKNLVRGLNPIMGTYSYYDEKKVKIWKVQIVSAYEYNKIAENIEKIDLEKAENGTILLANEKLGLYIKTIDGIISVLEIQGENAKRMNIKDFLRGNKIQIGKKFI